MIFVLFKRRIWFLTCEDLGNGLLQRPQKSKKCSRMKAAQIKNKHPMKRQDMWSIVDNDKERAHHILWHTLAMSAVSACPLWSISCVSRYPFVPGSASSETRPPPHARMGMDAHMHIICLDRLIYPFIMHTHSGGSISISKDCIFDDTLWRNVPRT